jgi:DNA-binding transcriptional MerR regulator
MVQSKAPEAFRTISELAAELGVAQHILRYWETKFPQLRPLQRAGNRRYYRPADVEVARTIHRLLNHEGYTARGVHKVLGGGGEDRVAAPPVEVTAPVTAPAAVSIDELRALRDRLAAAIAQ